MTVYFKDKRTLGLDSIQLGTPTIKGCKVSILGFFFIKNRHTVIGTFFPK